MEGCEEKGEGSSAKGDSARTQLYMPMPVHTPMCIRPCPCTCTCPRPCTRSCPHAHAQATHRRDAAGLNWGGALEELMVVVDGTIIWDSTHPPDDFQAFAAAFTAQSDTVVLQFKNNSPGKCSSSLCVFFRRSLRDAAAQAATTRCSWTW